MTHNELAKRIYHISHLTGDFKLRSGKTSHEYFDKYRFESQPELLKEIAIQMAPLIPVKTQVLAGLEMGGIPIATALSLYTGLPCAFIRKEPKSYGTCKFAEGVEITGKHLCLIEDVVSTGGQVLLSTNDLRNSGAIVETVLCVIYRNLSQDSKLMDAGLTLRSLFTQKDLEENK